MLIKQQLKKLKKICNVNQILNRNYLSDFFIEKSCFNYLKINGRLFNKIANYKKEAFV